LLAKVSSAVVLAADRRPASSTVFLYTSQLVHLQITHVIAKNFEKRSLLGVLGQHMKFHKKYLMNAKAFENVVCGIILRLA
jgi:hypothetical protein